MKRRYWNTNSFKEEVKSLTHNEYDVLGEYKHSKTKILIKHHICGYEYLVTPNRFLCGDRCPKCAGNLKKTHKQFEKEVFVLVDKKYSVLGNYVNNKIKILFRHNTCGYEYLVTPDKFINERNRCPKCAGNLKKTHKQFEKEVKTLGNNEYTVLSEYINTSTKISLKHSKCGYEYNVAPSDFLEGDRCPKCSGLMKKTIKQFKQEVYGIVKDEYTVLGEYINNKTKILFRHNACGHEYLVAPNRFLCGDRCINCSQRNVSAKEIEILVVLSQ